MMMNLKLTNIKDKRTKEYKVIEKLKRNTFIAITLLMFITLITHLYFRPTLKVNKEYYSNIDNYSNAIIKIWSNDEIKLMELENKVNELQKLLENYEKTSWVSPYDDLFKKHAGKDWKLLRAICKSESGLQNIRSHKINDNGTYDWGVCQINDIHQAKFVNFERDRLNPDENIRVASIILKYSGAVAWTNYNNENYKRFYN